MQKTYVLYSPGVANKRIQRIQDGILNFLQSNFIQPCCFDLKH